MYSNERVLVVSTALFHQLGHFQGFSSEMDRYRATLLSPENVQFRPRNEVELDPGFKQLIPYMIFCYTNTEGKTSLFTYTRGKGMGESRLHSKMSIGVGGHLNDRDIASDGDETNQNRFRDLYHEGMSRELHEEVQLGTTYTEHSVGMINDDENEVGRVHLGIVHRFDVAAPHVVSNEVDLIESGFRPVDELLALPPERFETWTSICLNALFRKE